MGKKLRIPERVRGSALRKGKDIGDYDGSGADGYIDVEKEAQSSVFSVEETAEEKSDGDFGEEDCGKCKNLVNG